MSIHINKSRGATEERRKADDVTVRGRAIPPAGPGAARRGKRTLEFNAAALVLAHNYPSGVAEPSQADELITRRLTDALA